ncbi:TMV resistance protein N-like, partial [Trifolium medium]|nr:TMV resistance protein N-like [Trifolium medium]
TEVVVISQIVEDVLRKLKSRLLNIAEFPIGLGPRVKQVIKFIENQTSKVCLIGIWGMGGSGKTTTARAIYNQIHLQWKFVDLSFIENIKDICNKGEGGVIHLQEQLKGKRALIVLDDVSTYDQVKEICVNRHYFARGSVLIVTSRDVRILQLLEVDHVYSIKEMDKNKSLELFSWHAFRQPSPIKDFRQLSENIVACCGGLPLALEAIGSSLRKRTTEKYFENALSELRRSPNGKVQKALIKSYDDLEDCQRNIFLDICCFFIGKDIAYVTKILNGCGFYAGTKITDLIERSLLKVEKNNKLGMHDLLRDMGRAIVERSAKKPGERSRLWFHEDGTKTVEGLIWKSQSNNNVFFKADSFRKMKKLRLLQLDHVDLTGDYVHLSQKLRWLHWKGFTGDRIPDEFYQKNLVVFELEHNNIEQVWNETKV